MTARSAIVRYSPDAEYGEWINVAVLAWDGVTPMRGRILGDWRRAVAFGAPPNGEVIDTVAAMIREGPYGLPKHRAWPHGRYVVSDAWCSAKSVAALLADRAERALVGPSVPIGPDGLEHEDAHEE